LGERSSEEGATSKEFNQCEIETAQMALAGLTCAIGKFWARAGGPEGGLSPEVAALESELCPKIGTDRPQRHLMYAKEFFQRLNNFPPSLSPQKIEQLALGYLQPQNPEQALLKCAFNLACSLEGPEKEPSPKLAGQSLISPLRTVAFKNELDWRHKGRLPLLQLTASSIFPAADDQPLDPQTAYHSLWAQFLSVWQNNVCQRPLDFVNRALGVLEHFTVNIPASPGSRADYSLLDQLKLTAALLVALHRAEDQNKPLLLISLEFKALEGFLEGLKSFSHELLRLRARSLMPSIYIEAVAYHLLNDLELPMTQIWLSYGGEALLIVPNGHMAIKTLERIQSEVNQWLNSRRFIDLSFNQVFLPASVEEFGIGLGELWRNLIELKESQRLKEAFGSLTRHGVWAEEFFLGPQGPRGQEISCPGCENYSAGPSGSLCSKCLEEIILGESLEKADRVAFFLDSERGDFQAPLGSFSLLNGYEPSEGPLGNQLKNEQEAVLISCMSGYAPQEHPSRALVYRPRSKHSPLNVERPLAQVWDFEDSKSSSLPVGCLMLDVDRFSLLADQGFGDDLSAARLSCFSRTIDYFFSLHFERLCQRFEALLIYSSGASAAVVAPFDRAVDMAFVVRKDFSDYCAFNPNLTLSASLAAFDALDGVSLGKMIQKAKKLLTMAKLSSSAASVIPYGAENIVSFYSPEGLEKKEGQLPKDRLALLGLVLSWSEFELALNESKKLLYWLNKGTISQGQLNRLLTYAQTWEDFVRTCESRYLDYAPNLARDVLINWRTPPQDGERAAAKQWASSLIMPGGGIPRLGFACRYALILRRF
jgi:CRISPR-associated protein Csm1